MYCRTLLCLVVCLSLDSAVYAENEAERIRSILAARIQATQTLHLRYTGDGKHYGRQLPHNGMESPGPDLPYHASELELWIAPNADSVRKRARVAVPFVPPTGHCTLKLSEYDIVADGKKILARVEKKKFEYQLGSTQTVVASRFRDYADVPLYATMGIPHLNGDLQFLLDDASDVELQQMDSGNVRLAWIDSYACRTELHFSAEPELALQSAYFFFGDLLNTECQVETHRQLGEMLVPAQFSFVKYGATREQKLEEGVKRLEVAEFVDAPFSTVFVTDIPTNGIVLDDTEPRRLKKMNTDGSLVVTDGTDRPKRWHESIFLWLLLIATSVAVVFLIARRSK